MKHRHLLVCCCVVVVVGYACAAASAYTELTVVEQSRTMGSADGAWTVAFDTGKDCDNCITRSCWEHNETTCRAVECEFWSGCSETGDKDNCEKLTTDTCRTPYEMTKETWEECPTTATCGTPGTPSGPVPYAICAYDDGERDTCGPEFQ